MNSFKIVKCLLAVGTLLAFDTLLSCSAEPTPDKVGICYEFSGNTLIKTLPCVVSTGSGAGALYTTLNLPDSTKIQIVESTMTEPSTYTINDKPAKSYNRDGIWFEILKGSQLNDNSESNVFCYQKINDLVSYCHTLPKQ